MFPGNRGERTSGAERCSMRPLPRHITALYLAMVLSFMVMFHIALVGADVLVYSQITGRPVEGMEFQDAPARFGGLIPIEGIKGLLSYSHPAEACAPIDKPPSKSTSKWIVLIRRCNCTFEEKVRNAEKAGFAAAIIHNVNSSDLEPMSANGPTDITIPSVFVGEDTGIIIRERFQWDEGYYIVINDNVPFNVNTNLLLPFVLVVGVVFLIMISFMIGRCIRERIQDRRHRLPSAALRNIPTTRYTSRDPYDTCAICLEDYLEGDKLRILPCSHAFHCKCIDPWLTKNRRECPMCKRKVFAGQGIPTDVEDSDDSGDEEAPQNRRAAPSSSDDGNDEAAPLIQNRGRRTQARRGNPRGGGTFRTQRENPFRRAARRVTGSLTPAVAPPPPPANVDDDDTSSVSSLTSSGSFNSLPSESNQQPEASQPSIPDTAIVIPADPNPSPARMSVNSNPADIQDVTTASHNVPISEEGGHGDVVV